jgi:hypothetical protein
MQGKSVYRRNWVYNRRKKRSFVYPVSSGNLQIGGMQVVLQSGSNLPAGGGTVTANPLQVQSQLGSIQPTYGIIIAMIPMQVTGFLGGTVTGGATLQLNPLQVLSNQQPLVVTADATFSMQGLQLQYGLGSQQALVYGCELALSPMQVQIQILPQVLILREMDIQSISTEYFPVEIDLAVELQLELQEVRLDAYQVAVSQISSVPDANFAEAVRSSSSMIVFGSTPGEFFKFNPVAMAYRRGGPTHVIQLAKTKPSVITTDGLFEFLSPISQLEPLEFTYEAPGGFLKIWNSEIIQSSIVADGDTAAILISVVLSSDSFPQVAATSMAAKRQF